MEDEEPAVLRLVSLLEEIDPSIAVGPGSDPFQDLSLALPITANFRHSIIMRQFYPINLPSPDFA